MGQLTKFNTENENLTHLLLSYSQNDVYFTFRALQKTLVLSMSFDRFLLDFESRDILSQADKSMIRVVKRQKKKFYYCGKEDSLILLILQYYKDRSRDSTAKRNLSKQM